MSAEIYKEIILDYYRHPRNYGKLENYDISARDTNPLCGDEVEMRIKVSDGGKIGEIKFQGSGCATSQASASMLTAFAKQKPLARVTRLSQEALPTPLGNPA